MQIIDMRRSDREGNIKAFFKLQTEEGLVIEGFKIMNGKNGLFASMPSKKVGEKFIETVTASREVKAEFQRTQIHAGTKNVIFTVYAPAGVGAQAVESHLRDIQENIQIVSPHAEVEALQVFS